MRRLVLICMMLLLPLQWSWAAAAAYCTHETGTAAKHPGHHEHEHALDAKPTAKSIVKGELENGAKPQPAGGVDNDCGACHLGAAQWLPTVVQVVMARGAAPPPRHEPDDVRSHIPPGPELPDRRLAA